MRAGRYIRISRADQNPDLQLDETEGFISRRGWDLAETYEDLGVSGARDRRPGLDRLLADARHRRFDALVVWRSDRLFRSLRHMVVTLDSFAAWGVDFVSVTEPFDTTSPQGRLLLHIASAFAEFERGLLAERTRAGLSAARRRGQRLGRPRVLVETWKAAPLVAEGKSLRDVADVLGVGYGTLQRAMARLRGGPESSPAGRSEQAEEHLR